jgi:hypothetical protein
MALQNVFDVRKILKPVKAYNDESERHDISYLQLSGDMLGID